MKCFTFALLFASTLVINQAKIIQATQHYAYKAKEDHQHNHQLKPMHQYQTQANPNNQVSQPLKRAQEIVASYNTYDSIHHPQGVHSLPQPSPSEHSSSAQSYQKRYTNVQYNVLQNLDHAETGREYHQSQPLVYNLREMSQQEKPSLLALLKRQQQELSEGYATFLQDEQEQQQHSGSFSDNRAQQHDSTLQQTNPQMLHYQQLQEQQRHLYYQQLQQEEQLQQQQQRPPPPTQLQQILYEPKQQQQLAVAFVTPVAQSTEITTPSPLAITQATVHPNLQHQAKQTFLAPPPPPPEIVSHATGNEASPPSPSINLKLYQSLPPPSEHQRNQLPEYAIATGVKYATINQQHNKPYSQPAAPPSPIERHPAEVYGLPPQTPGKHSKQVLYAPMRFDRKLPYSSKTFPYPPSFISLTTTERPVKYEQQHFASPPQHYYSYDHKSAYNKIPDLFDHRNAKSLLDSYIPSWQVVKMLQSFQQQPQHQGGNINHNGNLQTLATPYKGHFKRNASNQGNF
uniref:Uncharacterized protein n=1 Tax=Stomoxys calcitrans TaxID=35570 RepID=A0A1I8NXR0_STOCA